MFTKKALRDLNKQLEFIANTETNAHLTAETSDKDVLELCNSINAVLDKRRGVVIEAEKGNAEFKRAITNISHDLRTPLTSAIGYVQMLRAPSLPEEQKSEYIGIVESRLKSLSALMNNLFEYTQIVEGRTVFKLERVNLCNVTRDAITQFYGDFTSKGFEVSADIPDSPVYATCDPSALTRAVLNLIRNALEHGFARFELSVRECKPDLCEIMFANRVERIEELDAERIFERFYTSDFSRTGGNAGLGLAIAKELLCGMGGDIRAVADGDWLRMTVAVGQGVGKVGN